MNMLKFHKNRKNLMTSSIVGFSEKETAGRKLKLLFIAGEWTVILTTPVFCCPLFIPDVIILFENSDTSR